MPKKQKPTGVTTPAVPIAAKMRVSWYWRIGLAVGFFIVTMTVSWWWFSTTIAAVWPFQSATAEAVPAREDRDVVTPVKDNGLVPRRLDGIPVLPAAANPVPIAVMIDNVGPALPQAGLSQASLIYEALVEGSATRLMAVFPGSQTDQIGPVRSARPYFVDWAFELDAVYSHVGGSPDALAAISGLGVKDFSQSTNGKYYWRSTDRSAPHNVYTSQELIDRFLRDKGYDQLTPSFTTWVFGEETPLADRPTNDQKLTVKFANALSRTGEFTYDRATNRYPRWQAGTPHIDATTGRQVESANVVVVVIPPILDVGEKGRLTLDIHGHGPAYILTNGKKIDGQWSKADTKGRLTLTDAIGQPVSLVPGLTWIEVIPSDREVLYTATAAPTE